jgi:hypothetical protein
VDKPLLAALVRRRGTADKTRKQVLWEALLLDKAIALSRPHKAWLFLSVGIPKGGSAWDSGPA